MIPQNLDSGAKIGLATFGLKFFAFPRHGTIAVMEAACAGGLPGVAAASRRQAGGG